MSDRVLLFCLDFESLQDTCVCGRRSVFFNCRCLKLVIENCVSGDITLKVPADLTACDLDLSGTSVSVDSQLAQSGLQRAETGEGVRVTGNLTICVDA